MSTIKSEYYRFNGTSWDIHYFKTSMDMVDGLTSALSGKLSTTGKAADADKLDGLDSVGYLKNNDALMPRNAFGGRKLFTSHLDNAFFLLNERYTITAEFYNKSDDSLYSAATITQLFNSDYDGGVVIPLGMYLKLHISFAGSGYVYNGAECWPDYPYGKLYLSYYHIYWPESARFRVYSNYVAHGLGWSDYVNFGDFVNNGSTNRIQVATQGKYAISEMEIIVESPDTGNPARLTQIDFSLDRPTSQEMPVVSKFINQKIYKDLDFVGAGRPKVAGQQVYHPGNKPSWTDIVSKPSWIGASKPTYTAEEVGALPTAGGTMTGVFTTTSNMVIGGISYFNGTVTSDNDTINFVIDFLNMNMGIISNLGSPEYGHQAANKDYVDAKAGPAGVVTVSTGYLTLDSTHMNKFVQIVPTSNPTAVSLTKVVSDDVPNGTEIHLMRWGTNNVNISAGAGLTLYSINNWKSISGNYGVVTLKKINSTTWGLFGALSS